MNCQCKWCKVDHNNQKLEATGDGRHKLDWAGKGETQVMLSGPDGLTVVVGTIHIDALPLMVEPWMMIKVLNVAAKELTKCVANYGKGEKVN